MGYSESLEAKREENVSLERQLILLRTEDGSD